MRLLRCLALVAGIMAATSCDVQSLITPPSPEPTIDAHAHPPVVYRTNAFAIGETYTLGHGIDTAGAATPIRIEEVSAILLRGVEVVGVGAFAPRREGLALVPSWPPETDSAQVLDEALPAATWSEPVVVLLGVKVRAELSGLRGLRILWRDANGVGHLELVDVATLTCGPPGCPDVAHEPLLRDLGLVR